MTLSERFWQKVDKRGPDECWEWQAYRMPSGHGQVGVKGRVAKAHRVAWELTLGPIPEGLCVCHHCDNASCCNPAHLFLGTHIENMQDRTAKGREARGDRHGSRTCPESRPRGDRHYLRKRPDCIIRGERHGMAKLNNLSACGVMARWMMGVTQSQVATEFGITRRSVGDIVNGKLWQHLFVAPKREGP